MSLRRFVDNNTKVSLRQAYLAAKAMLLPICGDDSGFEARQLIQHIMGKRRIAATDYEQLFPGKYLVELQRLVMRRIEGEPLQYIIGEWEFMGLPFLLNASALIPRQDTETLAESAIRLIEARSYSKCLDICTGSGCIAIAVKKLCKRAVSVTAWDISPECIALAMRNAELNEVEIKFGVADLFTPIDKREAEQRYDIITANPPYIPTGEIPCLQKETLYEPISALDGGEDGLCFYRRIAKEAGAYLNDRGILLLEVGEGQAEAARDILIAANPGLNAYFIEDLCHKKRVVAAERLHGER